ncbi:MAG TPA: retroviral-like aspartic protease family protein [Allosphingosinicella sp.]|nr:retroviral-like aspartic protease family protein [Allosphingosinicella sp.]
MKLRLALLPLAAVAATASSPPPVPAEVEETRGTVLDYGRDRSERMTVPVSIGGRGPYAFIVDTGAERTAIAEELAEDLKLGLGTRARLHSMTEVSRIQTVLIPALEVGGRSIRGINAPALERRHIGAEGILGVDTLQTQRVSFDFVRQQMTLTPSRKREEVWPDDTIVITAKNRLGHLVLVDASVDGQKVWVILDTGAETTVANSVLRRKLEKRGRIEHSWPIELQSVTGGRMAADQSMMRRIRLGGVDINNLPVAFADVHPFRKLGLTKRPALLLGMDALKLFERVSVDFPNRRVRLLPPGSAERTGTRLARSERTRPAG